jgi:two-component system cell cycle sensor histidine kinase/response regulator CckA
MESFKKCADDGEPYDQEYPFTTTKGRKTWIRTIASPVVEDGKIVKVVGYLMDINDQKRGEQEKLLLERQVQHAQKLESLGVLAGGIAHDFNNLLMGIMGNADLALHVLSSEDPARMHLLEIDKTALRAAELAKQMLAYSGRGRFLIEHINLNALVEETGHLLEVSISKKAILKFNLAEELPNFRGDPTQVGQVVMNLITNASEAIGDSGGDIVLTTGTKTCDREYLDSVNDVLLASLDEPLKGGQYVYMEVSDSGCGMVAGTTDMIFDPFFTTKFTGRGLGMSSVLGIICGHKGAIEVESEVGEGTTFRVLFPVNDAKDTAPASKKIAIEPTIWKGTGTVLIVDDEESVRTVAKGMLGVLGFDTLEAPDGCRALEIFRENVETITCVLLDFKMPHMDGVETFREMRRISPTVKAILCSGFNETDSTERLDEGIAGFLQKPYRMAALKEKIRETLA